MTVIPHASTNSNISLLNRPAFGRSQTEHPILELAENDRTFAWLQLRFEVRFFRTLLPLPWCRTEDARRCCHTGSSNHE
jgi:hypothetical protein